MPFVNIFYINRIYSIVHGRKDVDSGPELPGFIVQVVVLCVSVKCQMKQIGIAAPTLDITFLQKLVAGVDNLLKIVQQRNVRKRVFTE